MIHTRVGAWEKKKVCSFYLFFLLRSSSAPPPRPYIYKLVNDTYSEQNASLKVFTVDATMNDVGAKSGSSSASNAVFSATSTAPSLRRFVSSKRYLSR